MTSAHTRWIAMSVMGSTTAVLCLGLDRFLPGYQYAPGVLSQMSDRSEHIELLEKQVQTLKVAVKNLTQSQAAVDQLNFSLRVFVHCALFGSIFFFKRYALQKSKNQAKEGPLDESADVAADMPTGLGDTPNLWQQELDGMKEKQAETAEKIAVLEKRAHSLKQDVREELRKVRQLAGISLSRAAA